MVTALRAAASGKGRSLVRSVMAMNPVVRMCAICGVSFETMPRSARYCALHRSDGKKVRDQKKKKRRSERERRPSC
jgi:hypothetical protein